MDEEVFGYSGKKARVVTRQLEIQTEGAPTKTAEQLAAGQKMVIVPKILQAQCAIP